MLAEQPGVLEPLGWDEAFLGVEAEDPLESSRAVQAQVRERTELDCSVGAGDIGCARRPRPASASRAGSSS